MTPLRYIPLNTMILLILTDAHAGENHPPVVYPDSIPPDSTRSSIEGKDATQPPDHRIISIGQPADPCEGVTCSGHGQCVIKDGNPVCGCENGYLPDKATGLHCVEPYMMAMIEPDSHAALAPEPVSARRSERQRERQIRREAKIALRNHPDFNKLRRKRRLGLTGTIVGGIAIGVGAMLVMIGDNDTETKTAGALSVGGGLAVFIPGIVASSSARRKINAILKAETIKLRQGASLQLSGVGLSLSPNTQGGSVSATFVF